jgi:hypothetical protein
MRGEQAEPRHESVYGFDFDESGLLPVVPQLRPPPRREKGEKP